MAQILLIIFLIRHSNADHECLISSYHKPQKTKAQGLANAGICTSTRFPETRSRLFADL